MPKRAATSAAAKRGVDTKPVDPNPALTPIGYILCAKELLVEREKWTVGAHARSDEGMPVAPLDKRAVCWSIDGALEYVGARRLGYVVRDVLQRVVWRMTSNTQSLATYNDTHSHAEVLKLFDAGVEEAENG